MIGAGDAPVDNVERQLLRAVIVDNLAAGDAGGRPSEDAGEHGHRRSAVVSLFDGLARGNAHAERSAYAEISASARSRGDSCGTNRPFSPSRITSRKGLSGVTTGGAPHAIASSSASVTASQSEGSAKTPQLR